MPQFRIAIEIVAGIDVLATIDRDDLARYRLSNLRSVDARTVTYESTETRDQFPSRNGVIIRVTYQGDGGMFD